ncbi:MAG: TetR/AcrR family transcriptional regulator [Mycobacteriales bacterium]
MTTISPTRRRFDEDDLLDAARAVFHAHGYSAAQTADIAHFAGTSRPTVHTRLGDKEDIYLRVIGREAAVFKDWISDAYARGRRAPLDELADLGMEPMFRFAMERKEGFDLLFRGDRAGQGPASLRRDVIADVTDQLTRLIEDRQLAMGPALGGSAATLAAACVGVAVQVCENALDRGDDLHEAHHTAASFVAGAFRGYVGRHPVS